MQLRRVTFGDDQVSLLFAMRAGSPHGIPAYEVTSGSGGVRVRLPGARLRHIDGNTSLLGSTEPDPPPSAIKEVRIADDPAGTVTVDLARGGSACARVASRGYGLGTTFAAAMISIALRDGPAVALDPHRAATGNAVQVIGVGFAPSSPTTFAIRGRTVWSSTADERGELDTVLYLPPEQGGGTVLVRDRRSSALAWFLVDEAYRR